MWMDEKWALNALWIMFHGLMYLVIGMRSIRPWAQKVVIGLQTFSQDFFVNFLIIFFEGECEVH
jgi:hypothetical protein